MQSIKGFYFFYFSALAALLPYLVLYYEREGLSGSQIGFLLALPPLMNLVGAPLWGALADWTRGHKNILLLCLTGFGLAIFLLLQTHSFGLMICLVLMFALFASSILPLIDSTTLEMLGDRRAHYGRQRAWGTIGWGIVSPIIGFIVDRQGNIWSFYGYFLLLAGTLFFAWRLPIAHAPIGLKLGHGLRSIFKSNRWLLFLLTIYVGGTGFAGLNHYFVLYLNDLGFSRSFLGWTMFAAPLSELPVMLGAAWLVRRWGSERLLIFALMALVIRMLAYSFTETGWVILAIQGMHGLTFGLLWIGGVNRSQELAPKGMNATAQGMFAATMGLGAATGALVGGQLYDALGVQMMYRWEGIGLLVIVGARLVAGQWLNRRKSRPA